MYIEQIYTKCLSQASYYLESENEAAIIDPLRDINQYLEIAYRRGSRIKYILETHFHADFVSGHLDLAKATGAKIVFGPTANPSYPAHIASHKELLKIGNVFIRILHTPGHTLESCCYLLYTAKDIPYALFTGDTLFVGDVGRPDLMSGNLAKEELARMLYDSIHQTIKPLSDDLLVFPGHGSGSACGKNLGKETYSTLGEQKKLNYAFTLNSIEEFVEAVCSSQPSAPAYFFKDAKINKEGYSPLKEVISHSLKGLTPEELTQKQNKPMALILDTRPGDVFVQGFIPGSLNISLTGEYAFWAGSLIPADAEIYIVAEKGKEEESVVRLARIGYDNVKGFLKGGFQAWVTAGQPIEHIGIIPANQLKTIVSSKGMTVVDIRRLPEVAGGKVEGSINIPLEELKKQVASFNKLKSYAIYCAGGYRSVIAASLLKAAGIKNVSHVPGGMNSIRKQLPEVISE